MKEGIGLRVLFSQSDICTRVGDIADAISQMSPTPDLALPILVGGFVFAADLLRALDARGVSLPVEFLQLRSYGSARLAENEIQVLVGPGRSVRGRRVLLIDGVLDSGLTLDKARELVSEAGARSITTAVVVDKRRQNARLRADFAAFTDIDRFVVGYGMDDGGKLRALSYIAAVN